MTDQLQRMMKKLEGDGPIEKNIILLKLTEALENAPDFGDEPLLDSVTPLSLPSPQLSLGGKYT